MAPGAPSMLVLLVLACAVFLGAAHGDTDTDICFVVSEDLVDPATAIERCWNKNGSFFNSSDWTEPNLLGNRSLQAAIFIKDNNFSTWIVLQKTDSCNQNPPYQNADCDNLGVHRYICFFSNRSAGADGRCLEEEGGTQEGGHVSTNSSTDYPPPLPHPTADVALYAGGTVAVALALIALVVVLLMLCRWRRQGRRKVRGSRRSRSGASNHNVVLHQMSLPYPDTGTSGHALAVEGQSPSPGTTPLGQGEYWFFEQPELPGAGGGSRRTSLSPRHWSGSGSEGRGGSGSHVGDVVRYDQDAVTHGRQSHRSRDIKLGQYVEVSDSQTGRRDTSPPRQNSGKFDTWGGLEDRRAEVANGRGLQTTGRGSQKPRPFRPNAGYAEPADSVFSEDREPRAGDPRGRGESHSSDTDYVRLKEDRSPAVAAAIAGTGPRNETSHTLPAARSRDNESNYDVLLRQQKSFNFVNPYEHILASNLK